MFTDAYTKFSRGYTEAGALVTHNANPLVRIPNEIYVGSDGDLCVRPEGSSADVTFKNLKAGMIVWLRVTHIRTTNTTVTNLIGMFE